MLEQASGFCDDGSLRVHRRAGCRLPVVVKSGGVVQDIAATPLFFESATGFRKALAADPANPKGRLLVLTVAEIAALPAGVAVVILDESVPTERVDLWSGTLVLYE